MVLSAATIEKIDAIFHMKKVHKRNGKKYIQEDQDNSNHIIIKQGRIQGPDQYNGRNQGST